MEPMEKPLIFPSHRQFYGAEIPRLHLQKFANKLKKVVFILFIDLKSGFIKVSLIAPLALRSHSLRENALVRCHRTLTTQLPPDSPLKGRMLLPMVCLG